MRGHLNVKYIYIYIGYPYFAKIKFMAQTVPGKLTPEKIFCLRNGNFHRVISRLRLKLTPII